MKLITKIADINDIGHDDEINTYLVYVMTDDNVIIKAYSDIIGDKVLDGLVTSLKKEFPIHNNILVPYRTTTEKIING